MPRWLQILLHILAVATGSYVSYTTGTALPLVVSGGVNAIIGGVAQSYNTDGTAQTTAYKTSKDTA
jgi:hypothetical protein